MSTLLLCFAFASAISQGEPPAPVEQEQEVELYAEDPKAREIGLLLRCPVCQGMPIVDSPADMAQSMMRRIREMNAEGKSKDEIIHYFTERYGDWVLLEPRKEGLNWVVWVMPPVFLLLGVFMALSYGRKTEQEEPASAQTSAPESEDPYVQAIRDEVDG